MTDDPTTPDAQSPSERYSAIAESMRPALDAIREEVANNRPRNRPSNGSNGQPLRDYCDIPGVFLELPISGRVYRIPQQGFDGSATLRAILGGTFTGPMTDEEFLQLALGSALDEMRAAGAPKAAIVLASYTAAVDEVNGRLVATTLWESAGDLSAAMAEIEALVASLPAEVAPDSEPKPATRPKRAPAKTAAKPPARAKTGAAKAAAKAAPAKTAGARSPRVTSAK